jgi:DHA1 family bicyclomycin/chloramphenicol resistance-like MFS transporter
VFVGIDAVGVQLVMPVLVLRMLDLFPASRGSAASVQSCIMLLIAALQIGVVVPMLAAVLWHLAAGSLGCTLVGCALWRIAHQPGAVAGSMRAARQSPNL